MSVGICHQVRSRIRVLVVLLLSLASLPATVTAQANNRERILAFDSSVRVNPDSTLNVQETIRVHANGGQIRHGILRDFPTHYRDASGNPYSVGFHVASVTLNGRPERFSVSAWQNGERVRIGRGDVTLPAGDYTYVITYITDHQLGFFTDHDELYWNATGFWGFDIEKATAHVAMPSEVPTKQVRVTAYTGPQGARGTAWSAKIGKTGIAEFATTAPLRPNEGLTIVIGWPKGFVTKPPPRVESPVGSRSPSLQIPFNFQPGWWRLERIQDAGGQALTWAAVILLGFYLAAWFAVGRDPKSRSIQVVYDPPQQLSPAAVRYVRNLGHDPKGFTSAVLSLASKSYLTIQYDGSTYTLTRTGKAAYPPLSDDEQAVATFLFTNDGNPLAAFKAQMSTLSQSHPLMAQLASGLVALAGTPDTEQTTRLRPNSPRVRTSFTAQGAILRVRYPKASLLRSHTWFVVLGVLYTAAVTYGALRFYPEKISENNWLLAPFACFFLGFNMIGALTLAARICALLPAESFAPRRSFWNKLLTGLGAVGAIAFTVASGWVVAWLTSVGWAAAYAGMWLVVGIFQRLIKAPTDAGQKLWDAIEGFRMFLAEVDEDRLNRLNPPARTPALFERMLPYAIALDCENAWAKQFQTVLATAAAAPTQSGGYAYTPSWYSGPSSGMSNLSSFTSSFSSSFGSAIASASTAPGSSSGFSGGGGGSSGGGGGGGGGGGW